MTLMKPVSIPSVVSFHRVKWLICLVSFHLVHTLTLLISFHSPQVNSTRWDVLCSNKAKQIVGQHTVLGVDILNLAALLFPVGILTHFV